MLHSILTRHWSGFDLPGRTLGQAEAHDYARACWPSGTEDELHFLAVQIATMTALDDAFEAAGSRISRQAVERLFPWRNHGLRNGASSPIAHATSLRSALAALDTRIMTLAPGTMARRAAVRDWWRRQAEEQVQAFYMETRWRLEGILPELDAYMPIAQRSIGVEWTAASLIALDPEAPVPGPDSALIACVDAISRALRLANDLHDPERERREGKVHSLMLRERQLVQAGVLKPAAEHRARAALRNMAATEAARARSILNYATRINLGGSTRLHQALEGLLSIGIAVYAPDLAA